MFDLASAFEQALTYDAYLAKYATPEQLSRWQTSFDLVQLTTSQQQLLVSWTRQVKVLCMAGAWCGDCIEQCPIFERFAQASPVLDIRYIDRDADESIREQLRICGAPRVPQLVFMNEMFEPIGWNGDRTLSKYRKMASTQLGAACPVGIGIDASLQESVVADWLNEFERMHWIVRLSPRLRAIHQD